MELRALAHARTGDKIAERDRDERDIEDAERSGPKQAREPDVDAHTERQARKRAEIVPVQRLARCTRK